MQKVKVLSLLQPWASAAVEGHKGNETRSWKTKHRGLLLIHASQVPTARRKIEELQYWTDFFAKSYGTRTWDKLPTGAIIGHVQLVGIRHTDHMHAAQWVDALLDDKGNPWPAMSAKEYALGDYAAGRYAWRLVDPVVYPEPIPCRGNQSVWNLPDDLREAVATQIRKAADAMADAGGGDARLAFQLGNAWSQVIKPDVQLAVKGIQETLGALRTFRESLGAFTHTLRTDDPDPELPEDLQAVKAAFDAAEPTGAGPIILDDPGTDPDPEKRRAFYDDILNRRPGDPDR